MVVFTKSPAHPVFYPSRFPEHSPRKGRVGGRGREGRGKRGIEDGEREEKGKEEKGRTCRAHREKQQEQEVAEPVGINTPKTTFNMSRAPSRLSRTHIYIR